MKKMKRTLMTGLAVLLLAGCSEDVKNDTLVDPTIPESPVDNSTLNRAAKNASALRGTFVNGASEGWHEDDEVCIYTLQSLKHNTYKLTSGAGTANAVFTISNGSESFEEAGKLYAFTSCKYLYGFSATGDGNNAQLSVTIPSQYEIDEVGAAEGRSRMPVPFWGIATFGTDGKLETTFQGMTALLKIDTTTLPEGTHAVVLTTKSDGYLGADALEPGEGEPLSGTFDTELKEGAKLAANPIFIAYDTLRVNLFSDMDDDENHEIKYRHVYIPVVAKSYAKLHVLAITGDADGRLVKHNRPHHWEGKVLETFNASKPFYPNTIVVVEPQSTAIHTPRM